MPLCVRNPRLDFSSVVTTREKLEMEVVTTKENSAKLRTAVPSSNIPLRMIVAFEGTSCPVMQNFLAHAITHYSSQLELFIT